MERLEASNGLTRTAGERATLRELAGRLLG
jgi:hypothetical protein